MQLAETELEVRTELAYVPHLDRLTLAFTTAIEDPAIGLQHWDYRFPVQMSAEEARELAAELLDFANGDTDPPEQCAHCAADIAKKS